LLLFIAAPMRRSGAYTIGDLVEARLGSPALRLLIAAIVVLVCGFYVVPQLKGAGLTIGVATGAPYWVGVVVVAALVALLVGLGGMRGSTSVQAFQFWVKLIAISVPAVALLIFLGGFPRQQVLFGKSFPRAPSRGLTLQINRPQQVVFPVRAGYVLNGSRHEALPRHLITLRPGTFKLAGNAVIPMAQGIDARRGFAWSRPISTGQAPNPLLVYSLLIGTCLGTIGLPNILVRFYTNPHGVAARRTNIWILVMLGLFYILPFVYSMLGRALTDSVVLDVPQTAWPGLGGEILGALVAAGAFAAFTAASTGLLVSLTGSVTHDVLPRIALLRRGTRGDRRRQFRLVAAASMAVTAVIALDVRQDDISVLVGAALGIAASTFCPVLVLTIWWRRLTARGAAAGMLVGGLTSAGAIIVGLILSPSTDTALGALLAQPAVLTVPLAFLVMIVVSLLRPPDQVAEASMLALHQPDLIQPLGQPR
jgi:cation/acetate symporter